MQRTQMSRKGNITQFRFPKTVKAPGERYYENKSYTDKWQKHIDCS